MAIVILGEDLAINHQTERTIAMNGSKVINRDELYKKDYERILEGVCEKVRGMVGLVLEGARDELQKELRGIGLEVMRAVMDLELTDVVGPKGKHDNAGDRFYYRGGSNPGSVTIENQRVEVDIPRAVSKEQRFSYKLKSYGFFHEKAGLVKRAYRDLIRGISTRRFKDGVEKFLRGYGFSASSISRHMVEATADKLKELTSRSLKDLDLVVLMIDGVRITRDAVVVVALGIDRKGVKHVLGLRQGSTENSRVVTALLEDLVERGLKTERPMLIVIDGAKALRSAVVSILGDRTGVAPPIQRCAVHKMRNVEEELTKKDRPWVHQAMLRAYNADDEIKARRILTDLVEKLDAIAPKAARSLEEGLDETLTCHHLGLPPLLRTSLRSTNLLESANGGVRDRARNVKRWHLAKAEGQIERWTAAGLLETEKGFRAIRGYAQLSILVTALEMWGKKNQHIAA